jgi:NTE family protein
MMKGMAGPRVGLVLAGGAARGAYEVGVIQYLLQDLPRVLGREIPLDILCGTSVGAINVCALAAFADEPRGRAERLARAWSELDSSELLRPDGRAMASMLWALLAGPRDARSASSPSSDSRFWLRDALRGVSPRSGSPPHRSGGIFDPAALEAVLARAIPFDRIDSQMAAGRVHALSVSTTHVATGRTVVFVQRADQTLPPWSQDVTVVPRVARIRAPHALASGAIPFLFPAVPIEGEFYCDGGLRQNVPLSPARRLGADGLIVVNPRFIAADGTIDVPIRERSFPDPLFLLGKTLNAILLDRIDSDIDRLNRINMILDAGTRRYGPDFVSEINAELGTDPERGMRPLRAVLIRASRDIGRLSADFVRSPGFRRRARGLTARVLQRLAGDDGRSEGDLLSYLLFDGEFARALISMGHDDAAAREAELCAFFESIWKLEPHARGRRGLRQQR